MRQYHLIKLRRQHLKSLLSKLFNLLLSVPVRIKILGIMIIPILILSLALNYWITTGLSDWLGYLIPDESVAIAMQAGSRSVILVSIIAASGAILLTLMLMFLLTQPLLELKRTALKVTDGNLSARARVWSMDEIGEVAGAFNHMLDHLETVQNNLEKTNRRLQLRNEVVLATTTRREIHDQLYLILKSILTAAGLPQGWIYLYNNETGQFHLATWHGVPDDRKEFLLNCRENEQCICQQRLIHSELMETRLITCNRLPASKAHSCLRHLSLPIHKHDQALGVINLAVPEELKDLSELEALLQWIQPQINEFVSKAWLEMKLSREEGAREKLMKALIKAQEDERSRLAKELHDGAGQMLTSLLIQLKAFERYSTSDESTARIQELCENTSDIIEYIRRLSYQNRPAFLYEFGLHRAIENLIEDTLTPAGIRCSVDDELEALVMPKEIEFTIYRIIQECFTNMIRHADAQNCTLHLWRDESSLQMEIFDDGIGMNADPLKSQNNQKNVGLRSIHERLAVLGGELTITSSPGDGTCIYIKLPLLEGNNENEIRNQDITG